MSAVINTLNTYATNDLPRGIAFKGADIWIALPAIFAIEQMVKATGAILSDHTAGGAGGNYLVLYDAVEDQFWSTGVDGNETSILDGSGSLVSNPTVGNAPYGQLVANGHYWCGNQSDDTISELDAASGAPLATVAVSSPPTNNVGQIAYDGANLWLTGTNNTLFQVDEATATLVNTFNPPAISRFGGICFALGKLWATDKLAYQFYELDLAGNVLNIYAANTNGPLCFDGTNFWSLGFDGIVAVTDPLGNILATSSIPGGSGAEWIANDGTPNQAWVTSSNSPGPAGNVQQFQFVPATISMGSFFGSFVAFAGSAPAVGGTK